MSQEVTSKVYECSPSQVSTYEDCPRKWAWSWLDGLEAPKHASALRGIKVHRHLELWLKKRLPPGGNEEARIAQVMLPHLPPPHLVRPEHVEMPVGLLIGDVRFIMAIDLFVPVDSLIVSERGVRSFVEVPIVHDHKTTSDFVWALAPDVMHEDVQASLYAAWAMVASKCSAVDVQWTYGKTRGAPDAKPVRARLTLPMISSRVERSVESARQMRAILEHGGSAVEVPYDASACEKYGGCPFQERCNLTPRDRLESIMSQGTAKEDFLKKLRDKKANGAPASPGQVNPPPVEAVTTASPATPPAPVNVNKLAARLAQRSAPAPQSAAEVQQPAAAQQVAAPAPEPEPEPAAAEEAPKARGRGRPAGSTAQKADLRQELWATCATKAATAMLGGMETADQIDDDAQDGVVQAASSFADKMLGEYMSRFGG